MHTPADAAALDLAFREARTRYAWTDREVTEADIRAIYALMKFGPTSANCQPGRYVWIKSAEARERLMPLLDEGNRHKSYRSGVIVIIGHDTDFHLRQPENFPHNPDSKDWWPDPRVREQVAFRNGTLQGAYLLIAARMLGFDCGPMSGFDNAAVDKEFFAGTTIKSNFICAIGEGTDDNLFPRSPRQAFDAVAEIL